MATREELETAKAALRAARTSLLQGKQVKEYWRDGRRVVYQGISVREITAAMNDIDTEVADLDAAAGTGRPRFHALSVRFCGR